MMWLEMSKDEVHGGGSWAFTKCLWSPSRAINGRRSGYWELLLQVKTGDLVLHLRGADEKAAFVGFSIAQADGFETSQRPPEPGDWEYSETFYYVPLKEFTPITDVKLLDNVFLNHNDALRNYFLRNKTSNNKKRLFYVIQSGRLQCQNGAYLSEVDNELSQIILLESVDSQENNNEQVLSPVNTSEQSRNLLVRIGQKEFSDKVRNNYGHICCFPNCLINEDRFLIGAHIARWSDVPHLRGSISNGLCLCLMHDKAFESGLFTISFDYRVWVNQEKADASVWGVTNLIPFHGEVIKVGDVSPSEEALLYHWERTKCYPEF